MSADWQFLVALNEHIRPLRDPLVIQTAAVRLLGAHLQANRVHYARIDGDDWIIEHAYVNGVLPFPARGPVALFRAAGGALRAGESVVVDAVQADPRLSDDGRGRLSAQEIGAFVIVPLIKDGGWLAVLSVHSKSPRTWTRDQIALIEVTADRIWTSAERARMEAVLGRSDYRRAFLQRLNDAIRPLGEPARILTEACRLLGMHLRANRVAYGEIVGDEAVIADDYVDGVPSLAGRYPWRALAGGRADEIASGAGIVCNDTQSDPRTESNRQALNAAGIGAYITPVLIKDGRWVAAWGIHSRAPRVWTEDEIALVQEVADRIWSTLEHRKAEAEIRANEERVTFVLRVNDTLRPLSDPGEVQAAASRLLAEHLGVTRVSYVEAEGRHYVIRREYARGVHSLAGEQPFAIASAELGGAFRRGETVATNDVHTDPRFTDDERAALQQKDYAAFVSVTISSAGRVQAAVCVNHHAPRTWTPGEVDLIRAVAERTWSAVERTRAEAAIRQQALQLTMALDASAAGTWKWDALRDRYDWDERYRALYGVAPDEPAGFDAWASRVHVDDRRLVARLKQIMAGEPPAAWEIVYRIVRPDGSLRWVQSRGQAERDAEGRLLGLTGLDLDFTEHQRTEEALQARRDEEHDRALRMLLETATQGVVSVDQQGTILSANQALEQMFGWAKGELLGLPIERLMPRAFRAAHVEHRAAYFASPHARSMGGGLHLVGERRDGSTFPIEVSLNHVGTTSGGRAFAFVTDITERERAATALQERTSELEYRTLQLRRMASDLTLAEQNAREQIAKTLHDGLQQMLVVVSLDIEQQLKRDAQAGAGPSEIILNAKRHLDEAIGAARSLNFELFPPVLQRSALPAALSWLANWTQDKYKIEVLVTADPRADSARKDVRTLLFESVRELLFNAVKHAHVDRVALDLTLDADDRLCITVSDDGIGFDPAALENRSKEGEVGWGLFSIRERLALLGGHLDIESATGKGTRFRLVAPRGRESEGAAANPSSPDHILPASAVHVSQSAEALRILIVDDHAGVRVALRQLLSERPQFLVVGDAANGIEAIAQTRTLVPNAIVMDVSMPEMDGIEATRRIRAESPEIQIFGLSMEPRPTSIHPIVEAGAAEFFVKGVDTQRLIDRLLTVHALRGGSSAEHREHRVS